MRGANVDYVRVAANSVVQMMKTDLSITCGKPRLQYLHGDCVVLCIVECNVANLIRRVRDVRIVSIRCTYLGRDACSIQ